MLLCFAATGCHVMFPLAAEPTDATEPAPDAATPIDTVESPRKLVFVTSTGVAGHMIGGLAGADAICQAEADRVVSGRKFLAWLSDSTGSPSTRFTREAGYELIDGTLIAKSYEDLTDGRLAAAIILDMMGEVPFSNTVCSGSEVWSNTSIHGEAETESCGNWSMNLTGSAGHYARADEGWTGGCATVTCNMLLQFYCFEQ